MPRTRSAATVVATAVLLAGCGGSSGVPLGEAIPVSYTDSEGQTTTMDVTTTGVRTLTLAATYGSGTRTANLFVDVRNTAPTVTLSFAGTAYVTGFTVLQETVDDELRGRTFATLYTVIDGKIARVTLFPDEEQALEAVGLRE